VLAFSGSTWTEIVITGSIVVPVIITAWLTWFFLRSARRDPDQQRLKRVQAEYEARQRER
jgi:uncharacterized membrane protein